MVTLLFYFSQKLKSKATIIMQKHIPTTSERHIAKRYLKKGEKLDGYRTLLTRCRKMGTVQADLDLIRRFLEKANERA